MSCPRRPRLNSEPGFAAKSGRLARFRCLGRIHVGAAVRMHLEMQVRVATGVARVAVPGDLLSCRDPSAVRYRERDVLTQPPLLSFRAVRSLFRWMYRYIVPLRP